MSDFYVTSDLHLNHQNIIQYCGRPFSSMEEMNEMLVSNWNSIVKDEDTIYVVGDVIMGRTEWIDGTLSRLKGNKILISGNHDKPRMRYLHANFSEVHKRMDVEFEGKTILLKHHPLYAELPPEYAFQICGHVHNNWKVKDRVINASVDVWDFKPVLFETMVDEYYRLCKNALNQGICKGTTDGEEKEGMGS
jgi:calcineurin-like phosphoesterase family protein